MSPDTDHDWSNPETKAIAYWLFDFGEHITKFDREEWLEDLIRENKGKSIEEIVKIALYQESGEPGYPNPKITQAAERLRNLIIDVIGGSFDPSTTNIRKITIQHEEEWEESFEGIDLELILELLIMAIDRVNWEEIVTVWLDSRDDSEDSGEEASNE